MLKLEELPYALFKQFPELLIGISPYRVDEEGIIVFGFMAAEVVNYTYSLCEDIRLTNDEKSQKKLRELMQFLEDCTHSENPDIVEAIGTGFLHGLQLEHNCNNILLSHLGDNTYKMLKEQDFWPYELEERNRR